MKGDLFLDGKMFISSERAAKFGGYTKDYIGQLCRGGKLEARMVGRSWYVSIDSLVEHKKLNPEGKFWRRQNKSSKKNKNEFVHRFSSDKALTDSFEATSWSAFESPESLNEKISAAGDSADPSRRREIFEKSAGQGPVSYPDFYKPEALGEKLVADGGAGGGAGKGAGERADERADEEKDKKTKKKKAIFIFNPHFAKGMALSLALFISVLGGIFSIKVNYQSSLVYGEKMETALAVLENLDKNFGVAQKNIVQTASVFAVKDPIEDAALSFYRTMRDFIRGSRMRILVWIHGDSYSSSPLSYQSSASGKRLNGMVVVPKKENEDAEETIGRIKRTFSDEVYVSPDSSGTSGVITPVFKKVSDEEYLYVLVPISD